MSQVAADIRPLIQAELAGVRAVFADVDGTLTNAGRLTSTVLRAIEWLVAHGVKLVLVSGRPSGWGECWARELPVAGVIVENGGLYFAPDRNGLKRVFPQSSAVRLRNRARLQRVVAAALRTVPGARLSSDSQATEVDLAIDYAEEARLDSTHADRLEAFLHARGVSAVRSSVHVNCWIGNFDKCATVKHFIEREWKQKLRPNDRRFVYVGDSFNDAPMFDAFALSVGVANVLDVVDRLEARPKFVTRAREGRGFCELVDAIARAQR